MSGMWFGRPMQSYPYLTNLRAIICQDSSPCCFVSRAFALQDSWSGHHTRLADLPIDDGARFAAYNHICTCNHRCVQTLVKSSETIGSDGGHEWQRRLMRLNGDEIVRIDISLALNVGAGKRGLGVLRKRHLPKIFAIWWLPRVFMLWERQALEWAVLFAYETIIASEVAVKPTVGNEEGSCM